MREVEPVRPDSVGKGRTVLLVDDDPAQRKLGQARLGAAGFVVHASEGPYAALEAVGRVRPDAILSVVLMKDLDGFTLCRMLRCNAALAHVPIVLMSAQFVEAADRDLALAVGASELVGRTSAFQAELDALVRSLSAEPPGAGPPSSDASIAELYAKRIAHRLTELANSAKTAAARYHALLDHASDAISILSPDGVILETNRRTQELLQYSNEEMVGRHIREFAAPGHEQDNADRYRSAVEQRNDQPFAFPIKRADGKTVFIAFSSAPAEIAGETVVFLIGRDVTEGMEASRQLEASEKRYRSLLENIPDVVWSATLQGKSTFVSSNVARICGFSAQEILDGGAEIWSDRIHLQDVGRVKEAFEALISTRKPFDVEYRWQRKDGAWIWLHDRADLVRHDQDGTECVDGVFCDVTERKRLEDQVWQSQKLEAVGQLTGGVAHDFNNIIATILAYTHFLLENLGEMDPRHDDAEEIRKAAERAASLTRQLLAFSRRQILEPRTLDLNTVVSGVEKMLRRVIGEDIELSILRAPDLGSVYADAGQIEQVVMNLVVNARDAMPTGGKLSIETANVELDDVYAADHIPATPGKYVMIVVSDSGCGMDAETKRRAFEPFFTTKEKGKGTGLGLSTSYGIVKQSGGSIWVHSEPGQGTVFKIYLPRKDSRPGEVGEPRKSAAADSSGTETILLLEDADGVRTAVERILSARGYRVLTACDGDEAASLAERHQGPIHLILSDVVMPGRSGPETVACLQGHLPRTKVLFMSGYTDHAIFRDGAVEDGARFLQKPFTPETLARKVREVLDA